MRIDLIKHLIVGFLISFISAFAIHFWNIKLMWLGVIIALLIGLGKELIWDKWLGKGTCEFKDLWCDLWGGLAGIILAYVIW